MLEIDFFFIGDATRIHHSWRLLPLKRRLKHYSLSPKEHNTSPTNLEFKLDQYLLHELKCSCGFSSKKKQARKRCIIIFHVNYIYRIRNTRTSDACIFYLLNYIYNRIELFLIIFFTTPQKKSYGQLTKSFKLISCHSCF